MKSSDVNPNKRGMFLEEKRLGTSSLKRKDNTSHRPFDALLFSHVRYVVLAIVMVSISKS
jgi:hypothetical protein